MFNSIVQWISNKTKTNKNTKKRPKTKGKNKTQSVFECMKTSEAKPVDTESLQKLIETPQKSDEQRMLTDEKGPPLFVLHIKNYQLLYYAIMLFFTMNLRMSYIFTRPVFWRWSAPIVLTTGFVFFRWRWRSNLVWFCIHLIMLVQNIYDIATGGEHYLPSWFVLYPTAPLVVCSCFENILFMLSNDPEMEKHITLVKKYAGNARLDTIENYNELRTKQREDRLLRWKLVFMNLFIDKDVRDFYPIGFEMYMPINGGGIVFRNCVSDIYGLLLWIMFVLSEDAKTRTYKKMFKLPSHIVKIVYVLYTPPEFWINISLLIVMNILVISDMNKRDKFIFIWIIAVCNAILYSNISVLNTCPLMY